MSCPPNNRQHDAVQIQIDSFWCSRCGALRIDNVKATGFTGSGALAIKRTRGKWKKPRNEEG